MDILVLRREEIDPGIYRDRIITLSSRFKNQLLKWTVGIGDKLILLQGRERGKPSWNQGKWRFIFLFSSCWQPSRSLIQVSLLGSETFHKLGRITILFFDLFVFSFYLKPFKPNDIYSFVSCWNAFYLRNYSHFFVRTEED